jgi:hypothetical protein
MFLRFTIALIALIVTAATALAIKPGESIDPDKAGIDYRMMGEYAGVLKTGNGKVPFAAQVIALGNCHFQAVFLRGGLPGAGWDGKKRIPVNGMREGGKILFKACKKPKKYLAGNPDQFSALKDNPVEGQKDYSAQLADGVLSGKTEKGETFNLKRTVRKSSTLGAKPPLGSTVILPYKNGTPPSLDGLTNKNWKAMDDGSVLCVTAKKGKQRGNRSVHTFGSASYHLHVEFSTPFNPKARGQGRGNSGVFPPTGREMQVLDSFALEGMPNECGGIYKSHAPKVNMCFPPLSWQTYDIYYSAPADGPSCKGSYRVVHNGVVIHEKIEIGGRGVDGHLSLQDHNDAVRYRNIWVVPIEN